MLPASSLVNRVVRCWVSLLVVVGCSYPFSKMAKEMDLPPVLKSTSHGRLPKQLKQEPTLLIISGGQLAASPESDQLLANAVGLCQEKNVLIVACCGK